MSNLNSWVFKDTTCRRLRFQYLQTPSFKVTAADCIYNMLSYDTTSKALKRKLTSIFLVASNGHQLPRNLNLWMVVLSDAQKKSDKLILEQN